MWRLAHFKRNDLQGFHTKFHNYGLIWTPGKGLRMDYIDVVY